jgi:hypothetical protein
LAAVTVAELRQLRNVLQDLYLFVFYPLISCRTIQNKLIVIIANTKQNIPDGIRCPLSILIKFVIKVRDTLINKETRKEIKQTN